MSFLFNLEREEDLENLFNFGENHENQLSMDEIFSEKKFYSFSETDDLFDNSTKMVNPFSIFDNQDQFSNVENFETKIFGEIKGKIKPNENDLFAISKKTKKMVPYFFNFDNKNQFFNEKNDNIETKMFDRSSSEIKKKININKEYDSKITRKNAEDSQGRTRKQKNFCGNKEKEGRIVSKQKKTEVNKKVIIVNKEKFLEIINILQIQNTELVGEITIQLNDETQHSYKKGDGKNVSKILGNFIVKFIKNLTKDFPIPQKLTEILEKVPKNLKNLQSQGGEYSIWLKKLHFGKFFNWIKNIHLRQKLTCRKNFQHLFNLSLVEDSSFKNRHYSVVLKRIAKYVLQNEFTRHLFFNTHDKKNRQTCENALKYISKISKFLKASKNPFILDNLQI